MDRLAHDVLDRMNRDLVEKNRGLQVLLAIKEDELAEAKCKLQIATDRINTQQSQINDLQLLNIQLQDALKLQCQKNEEFGTRKRPTKMNWRGLVGNCSSSSGSERSESANTNRPQSGFDLAPASSQTSIFLTPSQMSQGAQALHTHAYNYPPPNIAHGHNQQQFQPFQQFQQSQPVPATIPAQDYNQQPFQQSQQFQQQQFQQQFHQPFQQFQQPNIAQNYNQQQFHQPFQQFQQLQFQPQQFHQPFQPGSEMDLETDLVSPDDNTSLIMTKQTKNQKVALPPGENWNETQKVVAEYYNPKPKPPTVHQKPKVHQKSTLARKIGEDIEIVENVVVAEGNVDVDPMRKEPLPLSEVEKLTDAILSFENYVYVKDSNLMVKKSL